MTVADGDAPGGAIDPDAVVAAGLGSARSAGRLDLRPEPTSVGVARRWVGGVLEHWSSDGSKAAALIVSELVGNVVLHARTELHVSVVVEESRLRVEVSDLDPTTPSLKVYGADASTGRGLRLVSMLSDEWGIDRRPDGKTVWAELSDQPLAPGAVNPGRPS